MPYYLHDLIEDYEDQRVEDIQWKVSERKEFNELKGSAKEKPPVQGEFFNHQNLFKRYARQYDRVFNIHETGTGKTGSVINLAEYYRIYDPNKIKKVIVLEPGPPTVEDFKDQIIKLSTDDFYKTDNVLESTDDKGLKNNLTRLINKNYEVTTYQKFSKDNFSDNKIEEYYSDCIFFFDEAHKLRNLSDNSGKEITEDETESIYNYLWRITHVAKRIKVIVASATPMINTVKDFVPLINLLLDKDNQFPVMKDEIFYETLNLKQLEPYFRGMITFVRFLDTSVKVVNKGIEFSNFTHKIKVSKETDSKQLIPDKKDSINNTLVCSFHQNNQPVQNCEEKKITSKIVIYPVEMKGIQLEAYKKVAKKIKQDSFYRNSRQASVFVFPDGSYGTKGFTKYTRKNEYGSYEFRKSIIVKGKAEIPMTAYLDPKNMTKTLKNLSQLSSKFTEFIKIEFEASEKERKGNSFCYLDQVEGSGVVLLGLILETLGFKNFISNDSSIVNSKTGKIRPDFKKEKRFAMITGKTNNLRNILKVFNNEDNMDGEYIQIILASEVARDGINIKNVLRGYILSAGWHESGMHQALSRFIRATSHVDLMNRKLLETGNEEKIKVDVYRMASVKPNEISEKIENYSNSSVDIRNYLEAEEKDIKIKRILRFMKLCAFDAYINYERNFRKTDKDFTKESDYTLALPELWMAKGKPMNKERKGMALNQGPSEDEIIYNTYNLYYSQKDIELKSFFKDNFFPLLIKNKIISFDEIKKIIPTDVVNNDYEILNYLILQLLKKKSLLSKTGLINYNLNLLGNNFFLSKDNIYNYSNYISTENYYTFSEVKEEIVESAEFLKEDKLNKIYKDLEGKKEEFIINYYSLKQNYTDFKLLLEDSIIRFKNGIQDKLNEIILKLFSNYFMETKIPVGWFEAAEKALKAPESRKQGRKRAEGSQAGLKNLNLEDVNPKYIKKTVFIHFYRESDKTGFSITSILEGKSRKIRILEDSQFRDAGIVEEYIYTKLFDDFYDRLLKKYKKSPYYGSYIYRGGEQNKDIVSRRKEFFRIIDTSNPRNKGIVCINAKNEKLIPVLKYLDKDKKYKKYYTEKTNKNEMCQIIKNLFEKQDLLFISL